MNCIGVSALLLLILLPMATTLSCFVCSASNGNCNDPFTSTSTSLASGVTVSSSCNACVKTGTSYAMARACSTCPGVSIFVAGTGVACCTDRDYCNGASTFSNASIIHLCVATLVLAVLKVIYH
ncbi:unnamed protein product [Adineta ricciae]|uniref:Uncharacterized protein n=2 Tax=Adineta ricciae TaxID=249248 RepID=A0A815EB50_ADIRI|nr:unnamed protein product [Adineta ricciae]